MATKKTVQISHQKITEAPEHVDLDQYIPVINGYHGILVYEDSKTGETYIWSEFGDIHEMELKELRNAKNTKKFFFENNYFLFDDEYSWVIDYLRVNDYYKNAISVDGYSELFTKTPKEMIQIINTMTDGQKESLARCAQDMIASGEIDSIKIVRALEEGLGVALIDEK